MPPRRRETWGYRGVHARPSGDFSAEIRFRGMRLGLGNFDTANEAARAYDAVAWSLRWPHGTLNFTNMPTRKQAQDLAPLSRLITDEDRHDNRRQGHRLGIAEMDEEAMHCGANAPRRTLATSASSTSNGGRRGIKGGQSEPPIARTSVGEKRTLNST